jgi:hypothetical protein
MIWRRPRRNEHVASLSWNNALLKALPQFLAGWNARLLPFDIK